MPSVSFRAMAQGWPWWVLLLGLSPHLAWGATGAGAASPAAQVATSAPVATPATPALSAPIDVALYGDLLLNDRQWQPKTSLEQAFREGRMLQAWTLAREAMAQAESTPDMAPQALALHYADAITVLLHLPGMHFGPPRLPGEEPQDSYLVTEKLMAVIARLPQDDPVALAVLSRLWRTHNVREGVCWLNHPNSEPPYTQCLQTLATRWRAAERPGSLHARLQQLLAPLNKVPLGNLPTALARLRPQLVPYGAASVTEAVLLVHLRLSKSIEDIEQRGQPAKPVMKLIDALGQTLDTLNPLPQQRGWLHESLWQAKDLASGLGRDTDRASVPRSPAQDEALQTLWGEQHPNHLVQVEARRKRLAQGDPAMPLSAFEAELRGWAQVCGGYVGCMSSQLWDMERAARRFVERGEAQEARALMLRKLDILDTWLPTGLNLPGSVRDHKEPTLMLDSLVGLADTLLHADLAGRLGLDAADRSAALTRLAKKIAEVGRDPRNCRPVRPVKGSHSTAHTRVTFLMWRYQEAGFKPASADLKKLLDDLNSTCQWP